MAKQEEKYNRRRLRSAWLTTIVSITLVLFLLGALGILVIHAGNIAKYVKENIMITLVVTQEAQTGDVLAWQKQLEASPCIKSSRFISKEEAAHDLQDELGEEFIDFLGYNPIPATIDIYVNAGYSHPDSLALMVKKLNQDPLVSEVKYQKSLAGKIQDNIGKITTVILGFSVLLLVVSIVLIHNTIRLSIYSRRFIIRTMYLIGATRRFIRWPFIRTSIVQGFLATLISILLIAVLMARIYERFPEFYAVGSELSMIWLAAVLLIIGLFITGISTLLAVNKYLRSNKDKLYY